MGCLVFGETFRRYGTTYRSCLLQLLGRHRAGTECPCLHARGKGMRLEWSPRVVGQVGGACDSGGTGPCGRIGVQAREIGCWHRGPTQASVRICSGASNLLVVSLSGLFRNNMVFERKCFTFFFAGYLFSYPHWLCTWATSKPFFLVQR